MHVSKKKLREMFPNLTEEMDANAHKVAINSIRSDTKNAEKTASAQRNFADYDPDVIDFLRRCDNKKQATEIITYMETRGEITRIYAQKLRRQLLKMGVRSFGAKKKEGHYFKVAKP